MKWQKTKTQFLLRDAHSGRYYCRFYRDGKEVWRSLKTDVLQVARHRLAEELEAFRSAAQAVKTVESGHATVGGLAELYLQKVRNDPSIKASTRHYYGQIIKAILESWPELKTTQPKNVPKQDCEAWSRRFADRYSIIRHNNAIDTLRKIFNVGMESGMLYRNPAASLTKRSPIRKPPELPSPVEFTAVVQAIRTAGGWCSDSAADLVEFLAYSGCRIDEARHVKWADVQEDGIWIHGGAGGTKNLESRFLPMNSKLQVLINDIHDNPRYRRTTRDSAYVLAIGECQKAIDRACTKVGAKRFTHHSLRHWFTTRAIQSGVDIATVAKWLGHLDGGSLLMRTYSHLLQEHSKLMAARLNFLESGRKAKRSRFRALAKTAC